LSDANRGEDISPEASENSPEAPAPTAPPPAVVPFTQDDDFFPVKKPADYPPGYNYRRDREAARLKALGHSLHDIAAYLQLLNADNGEPDPIRASAAVRRGLANVHQFTVDEKRHEQLHSLEIMKRHLWAQMDHPHVMVQQGRVILQDGVPLEDRRFVLETMDRLMRIEDQIAKLMGTNATTRLSVEADQIGGEIVQLISMMGEAAAAQQLAAPPSPPPALPPGGDEDGDGTP
jgi:DNA-binding transcriptional MerR regulator